MRLALITPHYSPNVRGNTVTVHRIEQHLKRLGHTVAIISLDSDSLDEDIASALSADYDLYHAFHAHKGGAIAKKMSGISGVPYIVTLTGTDISEALSDSRQEETRAALEGAARIVAFHSSIAELLMGKIPHLADRLSTIPQGVQIPDKNYLLASGDDIVFLLPAGLRPIKNILFALEPLAKLAQKEPRLRLHIAGPAIDAEYSKLVKVTVRKYPFATYLGQVEHAGMEKLYQQASVVLNTSYFEGGMANSLLEAMAFGRPVLASDIKGNRSLVEDGVSGFLYRDTAEFCLKAQILITDAGVRKKLGNSARQSMIENHAPEQEAFSYQKIYQEVTRSCERKQGE